MAELCRPCLIPLRGTVVARYIYAMMVPPSLDPTVQARAYVAGNGKAGVRPEDTGASFDACRNDGPTLLGWEWWVVYPAWDNGFVDPVPQPGHWCGGMPRRVDHRPAILTGDGDGDVDETERQSNAFDFDREIAGDWLPHVRVNFTLA